MQTKCGYVAIIGRPNVGKSTLLNHLLGQKISITSRKPQTTRHRLLGIKTTEETQIIYVDTPGIHQRRHNAMNRYLNRAATNSLVGVDVVVWLVEALQWTDEDKHILSVLQQQASPIILGVNKIDKVEKKDVLLPFLNEMAEKRPFHSIIPLSALKTENLAQLETEIIGVLPNNPPLFSEDQVTDRSERFLAAETIREKLIRRLGEELPYRLTVQIEYFEEKLHLTHISAIIWVERDSQKGIVIGKQGKMLKSIGEMARKDLEEMLEQKVYLQLWVKVKQGWCDDERSLKQLGYLDDEN